MKTIAEYLDEVARTTETGSDYAIAQALGLGRAAVSNYRNGRTPDDNVCLLIADRLGIEPWEVIAAANAERQIRMANNDQAERWRRLWERARAVSTGAAAIIALAVIANFTAPSRSYAELAGMNIYVLCAAIVVLAWFMRPRLLSVAA